MKTTKKQIRQKRLRQKANRRANLYARAGWGLPDDVFAFWVGEGISVDALKKLSEVTETLNGRPRFLGFRIIR